MANIVRRKNPGQAEKIIAKEQADLGDWFRTTVGVRQGCLLSSTLFNIFLERMATDALEDCEGTVSIGGRTITNLSFADDIDGLAGDEEELEKKRRKKEEKKSVSTKPLQPTA